MSAADLSPFEKQVWRSFVQLARAWRAEARRATADQLTRWARIAGKTVIPGYKDDPAWYRQVCEAVRAAQAFKDADFVRREALWAQIEPVLDRLDPGPAPRTTGELAAIAAAGPKPEPVTPYYLRDN